MTGSTYSTAPPAGRRTRVGFLITAGVLVVAAIAAAYLLLADDSDNDESHSDNDAVAGARGPILDTDRRIDRMTSMIPDHVDRPVQLNDLEAIREQSDVARPDPGSSIDDGIAYFEAHAPTRQLPRDILEAISYGDLEGTFAAFRDEMGIELEQITGWSEWGDGIDRVTILTGNFDEAAVDEALRSNDWPGEMTEHEHRDVTYYAWNTGPDQHAAEATISNPNGVARRIALIENVYVITRTDPHMEALIDRAHDGTFAHEPTGARAVLAGLLHATRAQPPDQASILPTPDDVSATYVVAGGRRTAASTSDPAGPYAVSMGIDERIPDSDLDDEADRLIDDFATTVLRPEPGTSFHDAWDRSLDGRIITIIRTDP